MLTSHKYSISGKLLYEFRILHKIYSICQWTQCICCLLHERYSICQWTLRRCWKYFKAAIGQIHQEICSKAGKKWELKPRRRPQSWMPVQMEGSVHWEIKQQSLLSNRKNATTKQQPVSSTSGSHNTTTKSNILVIRIPEGERCQGQEHLEWWPSIPDTVKAVTNLNLGWTRNC